MNALDKKMWRDLWHMRGQALAISLVVMCGVGTYIMFLSTLEALRATQESYYREYRFAEVFVSLKRAPESLRQRLQTIPGIDRVETRVVAPVRLEMPDFPEPVTGLMVSLPDDGHQALNALYLREGRLPAPGRGNEVVVASQSQTRVSSSCSWSGSVARRTSACSSTTRPGTSPPPSNWAFRLSGSTLLNS